MKVCSKCFEEKEESLFSVRSNGKLNNFCKACVNKASKKHYEDNKENYISRAKTRNRKKHFKVCENCGNSFEGSFYSKCCSTSCAAELSRKLFIIEWQVGTQVGYVKGGGLSSKVERHIKEKYNNSCALCGWSKAHPTSGNVPLEIHHIDGNWKNATEDNLILLCPNCHSLTPTHGIYNKGNGRPYKRVPLELG